MVSLIGSPLNLEKWYELVVYNLHHTSEVYMYELSELNTDCFYNQEIRNNTNANTHRIFVLAFALQSSLPNLHSNISNKII